MGVASAISGGLGVGMGIYNTIQGAKQARDAEEALNNYERQKLENVTEGLQVSTLGADLQREEQARLASSQVAALREGGARTMGQLGKVEAGNQAVNRQIGADLDMQQKQIDQMEAEDQARIRAMQENREIQDVSALSSQYNAGRQTQTTGLSQAVQGTSMIGNAFAPPATTEAQNTQANTAPLNLTNPAYQSPDAMRNFPDTPYQPILTNQNYNPANYGPQNSINPFALPNPYQITRR